MWFDLSAPDASQAREFYSALLGWAIAPAGDARPFTMLQGSGGLPWLTTRTWPTESGR
jgi:predicted enzyme related to lactoylglutathione lyase